MQKFIVSVAAIVYKEDRSMLVLERSTKELQASGMLSYPGGKVEDFKVKNIEEVKHFILEETIKRELMEEAGVEVKEPLEVLNNHAFQRFDDHYSIMCVFLAQFQSQKQIELDLEEVRAIHWLKIDEIARKQMYPTVYKIYQMAQERMSL